MPSRDRTPSILLVPELGPVGSALALPEEERHYLIHVCRARPGDLATATDGRGRVAVLRVRDVARAACVEVASIEERARPAVGWVLAGAPEGGRADWMVEKLAELGVSVLQPVDFERARWPRTAAKLSRLRRLAAAALRQSRRAYLLEVREPLALEAALGTLPEGASRWLCSAGGAALETPGPGGLPAVGLVGPAEGLTDAETTSAVARGFRPMALSDGRLRTETATVAWASWWALGSVASSPREAS